MYYFPTSLVDLLLKPDSKYSCYQNSDQLLSGHNVKCSLPLWLLTSCQCIIMRLLSTGRLRRLISGCQDRSRHRPVQQELEVSVNFSPFPLGSLSAASLWQL
jgi:hypothetical protein